MGTNFCDAWNIIGALKSNMKTISWTDLNFVDMMWNFQDKVKLKNMKK